MKNKLHVFITGCTNSGTGFLRYLMSKNKKISVLEKEGQHYSKLLPNDNNYKKVKNRLFSLYPEIYKWSVKDIEKRNGEKIKKTFYKQWKLKKNILLEKSPHHMMRMEFMSKLFKPAKIIGIVRNGFVVSEGIRRKRGHEIGLCAKHWNIANKIMMEESKNVDFLLIKYESLVNNPQRTMDRIFDFIGTNKIKVDPNWIIPRPNMFGKKRYFRLGKSPDFNKESLYKLTRKDKELVKKNAKEMLKEFKYWDKDK